MASFLGIAVLSAKLRWGTQRMREKAAKSLGDTRDARAIKPLEAALSRSGKHVRLQAVKALGTIGIPSIACLTSVLQRRKPEHSDLRDAALRALEEIGGSEVLASLSTALRDPERRIQARAGNALLVSKEPDAIGLLLAALKDKEPSVKCIAAELLGKNKEKQAIGELARALSDRDQDVRLAVIEALRLIASPEVPKVLARSLKDQDKRIRNAGAKALGSVGGQAAIDALIPGMNDPDEEVRLTIVSSLASIGTASAIEPLSVGMRDAKNTVRIAAIKVLGKLREARAQEVLAGSLERQGPDEQWITAEILGTKGDKRCLPYLVAGLSTRDQDKQSRCVKLLDKLGWKPATAAEEKLYQPIHQRAAAVNRASAAATKGKWGDASQEGAAAILPLASAARRMNGKGSEIKDIIAALQSILEKNVREASAEELRAVADLPNQMEWTVKVITFAGDMGALMALGGMQREGERRFPVDCTRVKQLAQAELRRRNPKG